MACPTTPEAKKLSDRSIATDRIILRGGCGVNLCTPKEDYFKPEFVYIGEISEEIINRKRAYPGFEISRSGDITEWGFY